MRSVMLIVALTALSACSPGGAANTAPANSSAASTSPLPAGFPQTELAARGAECVVYLGLSGQANARPGGHDAPIMEQAAGQWQAAMRIEGHMSEAEVQQLVGSSVNPLTSTPAEQRDAASAWCVDNAPEPDPEH